VAFPGFRRGWDVDEEIVKGRKAVEGRDSWWNEKLLEFYVCSTSNSLSIFDFLVSVTTAKGYINQSRCVPHTTATTTAPTEWPTGFV